MNSREVLSEMMHVGIPKVTADQICQELEKAGLYIKDVEVDTNTHQVLVDVFPRKNWERYLATQQDAEDVLEISSERFERIMQKHGLEVNSSGGGNFDYTSGGPYSGTPEAPVMMFCFGEIHTTSDFAPNAETALHLLGKEERAGASPAGGSTL